MPAAPRRGAPPGARRRASVREGGGASSRCPGGSSSSSLTSSAWEPGRLRCPAHLLETEAQRDYLPFGEETVSIKLGERVASPLGEGVVLLLGRLQSHVGAATVRREFRRRLMQANRVGIQLSAISLAAGAATPLLPVLRRGGRGSLIVIWPITTRTLLCLSTGVRRA